MDQGSDEWDNIRRKRLTGSRIDNIISSRSLREVVPVSLPEGDELEDLAKKAPRQHEVIDAINKAESGMVPTSELNSSAVNALVKKGHVAIRESAPCNLKIDAARKMIDYLEVSGMQDDQGNWLFSDADLNNPFPTYAMDRGSNLEAVAQADFTFRTGLDVENVGFVINRDISDLIGVSPDGLIDSRKGVFEQKNPLPATYRRYQRERKLPSEYKNQVHLEMAVCGAEYAYFHLYCPGMAKFKPLKIMRDAYTESLVETLKKFEQMYLYQLSETELMRQEEAKEMVA